jgi:hypothetical protein
MEVANEGNMTIHGIEPGTDPGHGFGGRGGIDRDANQFRSGACELCNLQCRGNFIFCIRIGHRLHDDRGTPANGDISDAYPDTIAA